MSPARRFNDGRADQGGSTVVREYIKSVFRDLDWHVEEVRTPALDVTRFNPAHAWGVGRIHSDDPGRSGGFCQRDSDV